MHFMELVTSARVVCRSRPRVAAIPHVCDLIASCLAPPKSWTIENAIRHGCVRLVWHLLDELADNTSLHYLVKRLRARRYLSAASAVGDIALMEHLVERFGCSADGASFVSAIKGDHLEALQWLYDRVLTGLTSGDEAENFKKKVLSGFFMVLAGKIGHLEMLQWMYNVSESDYDDLILREAARYGHLHVVEWVLPMVNIPMPGKTMSQLTEAVALSGSFEVAKFLHSEALLPLTSDLMDAAARNGRLELLQWMDDNGGEGCTSRASDDVARMGHLPIVQWLHSKGVKFSTSAIHSAIENGHLAVVKFLHENRSEGCTPSEFVSAVNNDDHIDEDHHLLERRLTTVSLDKVAGKGGLEMLKWFQINCPDTECTVNAMDAAAANGHLEVVQFLHENRSEGCTMKAMDHAAWNDHLEIVQFLHENRTEGCSTRAMDQAARCGRLNMVTWLHFNRIEGCTVFAMDRAAENGHLAVVKFLHENRTEGCTADAMDRAAANGDLKIVQFLHQNRVEGCTVGAMDRAAHNGYLDVVKFLHENRPEGCTTKALDNAYNLEILQWLSENRHEGLTSDAMLSAAASVDLEKLVWLRDHTPVEMWTPMLLKSIQKMPSSYQVEVLKWLGDTFPEVVKT